MILDWHVVLGVAAGILPIVPVIPYIKDVLHGTSRPNIFSFALWSAMLLISIFAQFSAGASWSVALLIGDFIGTTSVVIVCLLGYGYGKYGRIEWTCTALAILAIVSWQLTNQPVLAIVFSVIADAFAAIPTLVKAYRDPWSEAPVLWLVIALGAACAIGSSTVFNTANLLFPAYLLIVNGIIGFLALFGRRLKKKPI